MDSLLLPSIVIIFRFLDEADRLQFAATEWYIAFRVTRLLEPALFVPQYRTVPWPHINLQVQTERNLREAG